MCLCCCCIGKPQSVRVPRYRYHRITARDLWLPAALVAALVAAVLVRPAAEDLLWGTPLPVRKPPLPVRVVAGIAEWVQVATDGYAGIGTDAFERDRVLPHRAEPLDPDANAAARAAADARLRAAAERAERAERAEAPTEAGPNTREGEQATGEEEDNDNEIGFGDNESDVPLYTVEDIDGVGGSAAGVRVYRPLNDCALAAPVVVHFHGGGFVLDSARSAASRFVAERVVAAAHAVVVAVEYRLAPEAAFPAAVADAAAALDWVLAGALGPHANLSHVVLLGAGAGANLALGAAMLRRDQAVYGAAPRFPTVAAEEVGAGANTAGVHSVVCVDPWLFQGADTASRRRFAETGLLSGQRLAWYEAQYRQGRAVGEDQRDLLDPTQSPHGMHAMPPTHVFTCGVCFFSSVSSSSPITLCHDHAYTVLPNTELPAAGGQRASRAGAAARGRRRRPPPRPRVRRRLLAPALRLEQRGLLAVAQGRHPQLRTGRGASFPTNPRKQTRQTNRTAITFRERRGGDKEG